MKFLFLVCLLVTSTQTFAGNGGVGGGGVLVCPKQPVELFDLFEAAIPGEVSENGLNILRTQEDVDKQIAEALSRLEVEHEGFAKLVRSALDEITKIAKPISRDVIIVSPTDVNNEVMKRDCVLKGVAIYNDKKRRLLYDQDLYDRMRPTDQAALWMHEAIYKVLRDLLQEKNSILARKIVAYLFSDVPPAQYPFDPEDPWAMAKYDSVQRNFGFITSTLKSLFFKVEAKGKGCASEFIAYERAYGEPLKHTETLKHARTKVLMGDLYEVKPDPTGNRVELQLHILGAKDCLYTVSVYDFRNKVIHTGRLFPDIDVSKKLRDYQASFYIKLAKEVYALAFTRERRVLTPERKRE